MLFNYQCSCLLFFNSHINLTYLFMFVNNFFNFFKKSLWSSFKRRRRDLNPRAAINDLLPFQGSPFSHLGTSPAEFIKCIQFIELLLETEKVGFEPTAPFGVTGFQDRLLKPLGHLSKRCLNSIPKIQVLVNNFFLFLHQNILSLDPNRAPPLHR